MLIPINQAVNYIREKYDIPKEWTSVINLKVNRKQQPITQQKQTDIRAYINHLSDKGVIGIEVNKNGTILYETDDLDAVFSNWNRTVSISYGDVSDTLKYNAKEYIKKQLLNGFDIGVIKYDLTSEGLFKQYKNKKLKVMNSKGKFVS